MSHNVLAISYAKRVLDAGSREQIRIETFSRELDRHIMVVFTRAAEGRPREYHKGNLSVYGTHSRSSLGMLWDGYRLTRQLLRAHRDQEWVVSSQDPFETSIVGYLAARTKNAMHHIQIHGDNFGNQNWITEKPLNRLRYYFGLFVLRRAGGIRVVSKRIKQALAAVGIPETKITVLPVQVRLEQFLAVGAARDYSVSSEPTKFLYAGRFSREKRLSALVSAIASLRAQHYSCELTLVGEGSELITLKKQVAELGVDEVVHFLPWTDNVPALMAAHDVFVLNSAHEGYALVLIEAMAAGMAVVSTDVGCVGEVVRDKEHGVIVTDDLETPLQNILPREVQNRYKQAGYTSAAALHTAQANYAQAWKASFVVV